MKNPIKSILQGWNEFWFAPANLVNLGLFRIFLCATMFMIYLSRQKDLDFYFTDLGFVPKSQALDLFPEFYRPDFTWFFWPDQYTHLIHILFLIGLFFLTMGLGGRLLCIFVWVIHSAFLQRNFAVQFGADTISAIFLFYMCFTESCAEVSVQKWLRVKFFKNKKEISSDLFTSAFYRIIQIQLCVVYAYSGMEKLRGGTWWDGTALWSVLANSQMVILDFTWVRNVAWIVPLLTFSTLLFEIYFPVLIWFKQTRLYVFAAGVMFHLGIAVVMSLYGFAAVMISPYLLFIPSSASARIKVKIDRLIGG